MKKFPMALVCGVATIVVTILLYFTILSNVLLEAIHFIALVAIVVAEMITTGYACLAKGSPRKVAAVVVSALTIPAAIVLSVVYMVNFPYGYGTYLGLYFALLLIANVIALILVHFDANRHEQDNRFQEAKSNMLVLRKLVKCVMAETAAQPYQARLRKLEENLHFSNDGVIVAEDEEIRQMLLQLQEKVSDPEFGTEELLDKIEKTVQQRKIMTSRNV